MHCDNLGLSSALGLLDFLFCPSLEVAGVILDHGVASCVGLSLE